MTYEDDKQVATRNGLRGNYFMSLCPSAIPYNNKRLSCGLSSYIVLIDARDSSLLIVCNTK